MKKYQEVYLKRKIEQVENIMNMANPGNITDEQLKVQKVTGCLNLFEDLYLLGLDDNPNVTSAVEQLFQTDEKYLKDIQKLYEEIKVHTNKRIDLINGFINGIKGIIQTTPETPEFNMKPEEKSIDTIHENVDKQLIK